MINGFENNKKTVCILLSLIFLVSLVVAIPIITIDSPLDSSLVVGDSVPLNWNLDTTGDTISSCFFNLDGEADDFSIFFVPTSNFIFQNTPNESSFPADDTVLQPLNDSAFVFVNYTKPLGATNNSRWEAKWNFQNSSACHFPNRTNFTIPSGCWDFSAEKISVKFLITDQLLNFSCLSGDSVWESIYFEVSGFGGATGQPTSKFYASRTVDGDFATMSMISVGGGQNEWTRTSCSGQTGRTGFYDEAMNWDIASVKSNSVLQSLTEGSHEVVVSCNNSINLIGTDSSTFNVFIQLFPNEIAGEGELFDVLRSSGAGLSTFIQFMSRSLPVLLIILVMVGIIVAVGLGISTVIRKSMVGSSS